MTPTKLTVIAPVFNEESIIGQFHERTSSVLDRMEGTESRILYVVDRCTDNTVEVLRDIASRDRRTTVLVLSARFGHQMSLLAGIEHSRDSDAIVMMDSDLQHPPELIPDLVKYFRNGNDVVYTVRIDAEDVSTIRKSMGNLFYRLLNLLSDVHINPNAADFRLISHRVANTLCEGFAERNMFLRGLFSWMGFRQFGIEFVAERRAAGVSKYSFPRMLRLALSGILSFSTKPLQIGIFAGGFFGLTAFIFMLVMIINYFFDRSLPSGWTTLVTLLLFFSALQLTVLGVMGVYLGGIYEEIKCRPRYIVDEEISHRD